MSEAADRSLFVFAYGSLMAAAGLRETLPDYVADRCPPVPARLRGFRKDFSAIHANIYGFSTTSGFKPPWIGYMNIAPDPSAAALGVLLRVSAEQFERLRLRESGYRVRDLATAVERLEGSIDSAARVCAFSFPHQPELEKASAGQIGIGSDYEAVIAEACAAIDEAFSQPLYAPDFANICQDHCAWPRLTHSNPRTGGNYP